MHSILHFRIFDIFHKRANIRDLAIIDTIPYKCISRPLYIAKSAIHLKLALLSKSNKEKNHLYPRSNGNNATVLFGNKIGERFEFSPEAKPINRDFARFGSPV